LCGIEVQKNSQSPATVGGVPEQRGKLLADLSQPALVGQFSPP
jgi:hypothetical protein